MTRPRRIQRLRRVAVVTGTRAEYGLLRSTMTAIRTHPRLRLQLAVTGMHLLPKFGRTVKDIIRDGWRIDARVRMQAGDDDPLDQAVGLSRGVAGVARFLQKAKTDIVLVLGDRIEAMAGALAAVTTGRLLAHVHGGDVAPGDFDEGLRHAITKLAHIHFPATDEAARNLVRMGEPRERIHRVGAPGLDELVALLEQYPRRAQTRTGQAMILHHATGQRADRERRTMSAILRAATAAGLRRTIIYPNADRGHTGIIAAIESHAARSARGTVEVTRSLQREAFLRLLIESDVLIGNSSCGVIEAPTAGTASVNVGPRQTGRRRGGGCVVDAAETGASIGAAVAAALRKRPIRGGSSPYGDGNAGVRIAAALAAVPHDEDYRRKLSTYARGTWGGPKSTGHRGR